MFIPEDSTLFILSGGKSSRFGRDKATAEVDGIPMALHPARTFGDLFQETVIVSNGSRDYANLGLMTIHDRTPDLGPCGGIAAALHYCKTPWAFICACDVTGLRVEDLDPYRGSQKPAGRYDQSANKWGVFPLAVEAKFAQQFSDAGACAVWKVLESLDAKKMTASFSIRSWNAPSLRRREAQ